MNSTSPEVQLELSLVTASEQPHWSPLEEIGGRRPLELPNEVNLWRLKAVEKHEGYHWKRAILRDLSRLIEAKFPSRHSDKVNPLCESYCTFLGTEAGQTVNTFMAEAPIAVARWVMQNVQVLRKSLFET